MPAAGGSGKPPIEFYFDPISPYGYLATTKIEGLAARYGREVDWKLVERATRVR